MGLERMFDGLFTTYSNLDPPPIKRNVVNLELPEMDYGLYESNIGIKSGNQDISQNLEQQEIIEPFHFQTDEPNFIPKQVDLPTSNQGEVILKGPKTFEKAFSEALRIDPSIAKYKKFLTKTAKIESNFNSYIQNTAGAPYYGYFQMGRNEIAVTTKIPIEKFRSDPVAQILGACKLYEMNLDVLKKIGVYNLGKQKGFSDDALVAGAWLGGPGGVKKYLLNLGDPSDSHWYNKKGGTSVGKRMKEFNN